ncbi:MAG: nicotinate phosphoribosyltransferase [Enterobacteriaceae bacterium]|jgi:nicotinamide phosphoribosyltransferase|uniref:nicotinate phosphoribosyltransferase n=1 Tax=Phytobacter diazotrophicus TaxID=395631 RepID=UPI0005A47ED1|nr:nicotinate phosphoribosyltransferase [Phytobacter diazotrophicus]MDU4998266.1 nicotinate phosphoribosyltransferase [Enterobacteriaceae bacterium]SLK00912.1 nicotinamide phosphoribosyltransferase [Enterobacter sp. NFR05]MBY6258204.1 nicotinate phosphoribosyltransferase [Phytobacter diazotrophicus]MDU7197665.1 nicotinate phosphoribosyltransferase [Enterobacteriaceae bacterium]MDV2872385.1 nicotinate phosphoribosyltransferase [Phytobacter diazotrophicus]
MKMNPILAIDGYKVSHRAQYPQGTTQVYSNFTPRSDRFFSSPVADGKLVFFGLQGFLQWFMVDLFNDAFFARPQEDVVNEYKAVMDSYLGKDAVPVDHIRALHNLGYLPLHIKSLDEGSKVPMKVPVLTITNTRDEFFWLVNYLETVLSAELWKASTNATIAHHYRKVCEQWAVKTCSDMSHLDFQCHDFSFRGMAGLQDTMQAGAGHLLSFKGTDSIPSLLYARDHYTAGEDYFIGASIPATEHSVMCMGEKEQEIETFRRLIVDLYPQGFVSIVSDTWDYWRVMTEYTRELKQIILNREGRVVFRPDSGDPVEILCGTGADDDTRNTRTPEEKGSVEVLWEIFGGTVNEKGYKVLDPHVGLIYGDSITLARADEILRRLEAKGFASSNVVFGVGSFTYQYNTRDTFGFAMKATWGAVNGEGRMIFKEPKTDSGLKRSARGLLRVERDAQGELQLHDEQTWEQEKTGELKTRFLDGKLYNVDHFEQIRQRLTAQR